MNYCLTTTQSHPFCNLQPSCCLPILEIIQREGGSGRAFPNHIVMDLDRVEAISAQRQGRCRRHTMDIAFGCSDKRKNRKSIHITSKCICLVDFKFNTISHNFGAKADFEDKVKDSICLLSRDIPIYKQYYFIYPSNLKQQAISRIARLFYNRPNCPYVPLTEVELLHLM